MALSLKGTLMEASLYGFLLEVLTLMEHLMANIFQRNSAEEIIGKMNFLTANSMNL